MSRIVIVGASGLLGRALVQAFRTLGDEVIAPDRTVVDIEKAATLESISGARPQVVVNAAAWTDVDGCAQDPDRAKRINGEGAGRVAAAAAQAGALAVHVSTNEVFDGSASQPYAELDATEPINPYGQSKLEGERAVAAATRAYLVIRTAWLFDGSHGFPARIVAAADRIQPAPRKTLRVVHDERGNPTWVPGLALRMVQAVRIRLQEGAPDLLHLAGSPPVSRFEWARDVLATARPSVVLEPIPLAAYSRPSRVPPRAVLSTDLAIKLGIPPLGWKEHLAVDGGVALQ